MFLVLLIYLLILGGLYLIAILLSWICVVMVDVTFTATLVLIGAAILASNVHEPADHDPDEH